MMNQSKLSKLELSTETVISCQLCHQEKPKYTCPKCEILYCSLTCYRSFEHVHCSENFFKECVVKELESNTRPGEVCHEMKKKMESILRKANEEECNQNLDSDDSENGDQEDISNRLKNIDLNDSASVWNHLNQREKADFQELINSGQIMEFVPHWDPWWMQSTKQKLVEELDILKSSSTIPSISMDIPLLSSIMKKKPNESVINGLPNILFAYACVSRLFMQDWTGEIKPIIDIFLTICAILETNILFETAERAIKHAQTSACKLVDVSDQLSLLARNDVYHILNQSNYVMASLSDVIRLFHKYVNDKDAPKKRVFLARKKVEFYLSYVNEYGIRALKLF